MSAIYTPTSPTLLTSPALPHLQLCLQRVLTEACKTPGGRGREGDIEKFLRLHAAEFDRVLLTLDMAASDRLQGVVGRGLPVAGPGPRSRAVGGGGGSAAVADAVDQTPTDEDDDEDDGSDTPRQRGFDIGSSLLRGQSPVD